MTVADINIFLFIIWAIIAEMIMTVVLTIIVLFISDIFHKVFKRGN